MRQARAAEASGFDTVLVMDHFYQLPGLGAPEHEMLECYTLLAALAQHTQRDGELPLWSRATPTATPPCWPRK